ncbi:MAG: hypothetical protein ACN6O2_00370 [Stenotrophomonas sp.]
MVPNPNPILRLRTVCLHAAFVAGAFALCGCAQYAVGSAVTQEEPMHGSSSNEGARTEADKVAALVDSIADKVVAGRPINGVEPKADPLHGPDITAQVLEERLLALASALRTPDQVKVRFFEQILGFSISSPETGKVVGTQGAVGQGTYLLEVEPPYDGGPLGNLDVQLRSDSPTPCEFSYRSVAHKLESMSYQAFPRPKYQDPGVEFVREAGRFAAIVTLSVDSRESPRCIRNINFVLQDVKDGRLED